MEKKKILFLEDDDAIRDVVNEYLTIAGYETTLVTDGEAAIEPFPKMDTFGFAGYYDAQKRADWRRWTGFAGTHRIWAKSC